MIKKFMFWHRVALVLLALVFGPRASKASESAAPAQKGSRSVAAPPRDLTIDNGPSAQLLDLFPAPPAPTPVNPNRGPIVTPTPDPAPQPAPIVLPTPDAPPTTSVPVVTPPPIVPVPQEQPHEDDPGYDMGSANCWLYFQRYGIVYPGCRRYIENGLVTLNEQRTMQSIVDNAVSPAEVFSSIVNPPDDGPYQGEVWTPPAPITIDPGPQNTPIPPAPGPDYIWTYEGWRTLPEVGQGILGTPIEYPAPDYPPVTVSYTPEWTPSSPVSPSPLVQPVTIVPPLTEPPTPDLANVIQSPAPVVVPSVPEPAPAVVMPVASLVPAPALPDLDLIRSQEIRAQEEAERESYIAFLRRLNAWKMIEPQPAPPPAPTPAPAPEPTLPAPVEWVLGPSAPPPPTPGWTPEQLEEFDRSNQAVQETIDALNAPVFTPSQLPAPVVQPVTVAAEVMDIIAPWVPPSVPTDAFNNLPVRDDDVAPEEQEVPQLLFARNLQDVQLDRGESFGLSVAMRDPRLGYSYQWFHNGVETNDANEGGITRDNTGDADIGTYWVVVTDNWGRTAYSFTANVSFRGTVPGFSDDGNPWDLFTIINNLLPSFFSPTPPPDTFNNAPVVVADVNPWDLFTPTSPPRPIEDIPPAPEQADPQFSAVPYVPPSFQPAGAPGDDGEPLYVPLLLPPPNFQPVISPAEITYVSSPLVNIIQPVTVPAEQAFTPSQLPAPTFQPVTVPAEMVLAISQLQPSLRPAGGPGDNGEPIFAPTTLPRPALQPVTVPAEQYSNPILDALNPDPAPLPQDGTFQTGRVELTYEQCKFYRDTYGIVYPTCEKYFTKQEELSDDFLQNVQDGLAGYSSSTTDTAEEDSSSSSYLWPWQTSSSSS